MKSMNEIINSIKDENLRRFAIGLKEKLEVAKNAITRKKKNGGEVTGAEKSALQTSTSNYVKKNRGNVSQKVAGALAALMLVSMLSSCDELVGDLVNGTEIEDTADGSIDAPAVDSEDFLEVEEFSSKPFNPENCGRIWPLLSTHDYSKTFKESESAINGKSSYEVLKEDYEDRVKAFEISTEEFYNCSYDPHLTVALYKVIGDGNSPSNFSFDFYHKESEWGHRLVSAGNSFALVSTDPDGNVFLTGFVNGRLENDLGFIDESSIKLAKGLANKYSYTDILNSVRRNLFGLMYASSKSFDGRFSVAISIHDNELDALQWDYEIDTAVWTFPENNLPPVHSDFNHDVPDNYFEQLFEEGRVVDGTIIFDEASQDYYIPGYIQEDDNTADNDSNTGEDDGAERDPNAGEPEMGEDDETVGGEPGHLEDEEVNEG